MAQVPPEQGEADNHARILPFSFFFLISMRIVFCIFQVKRRYNSGKAATSAWVCKQCAPSWANHPVHLIWTPFNVGKPEHWVGPHQYHFIKGLWVHIVCMHSLAAVFPITALQRPVLQNNLSTVRVISFLSLTAPESGRDYFCVSNLRCFPKKSHGITQECNERMNDALHPVTGMGVAIRCRAASADMFTL